MAAIWQRLQNILKTFGILAVFFGGIYLLIINFVPWLFWLVVVLGIALIGVFVYQKDKENFSYPLRLASLIAGLSLAVIAYLGEANALTLKTLWIISISALALYLIVLLLFKIQSEAKIVGLFLLTLLLITSYMIMFSYPSAPGKVALKGEQVSTGDIIPSFFQALLQKKPIEYQAPDGSIFYLQQLANGKIAVEVAPGETKEFESLEEAKKFIDSTYNVVYKLITPDATIKVVKTQGNFEVYKNDELVGAFPTLEEAKKFIYKNLLK